MTPEVLYKFWRIRKYHPQPDEREENQVEEKGIGKICFAGNSPPIF